MKLYTSIIFSVILTLAIRYHTTRYVLVELDATSAFGTGRKAKSLDGKYPRFMNNVAFTVIELEYEIK